mmetsp:Transcript_22917/g.32802  ORF Transcript_22917/g.32802 Transcript_22917/m.32802 type:complete len:98 (-) Transcript_22917:178-471(-)
MRRGFQMNIVVTDASIVEERTRAEVLEETFSRNITVLTLIEGGNVHPFTQHDEQPTAMLMSSNDLVCGIEVDFFDYIILNLQFCSEEGVYLAHLKTT